MEKQTRTPRAKKLKLPKKGEKSSDRDKCQNGK